MRPYERPRPTTGSGSRLFRRGSRLEELVDQEQVGEQRAQVNRRVQVVYELRADGGLGENELNGRLRIGGGAVEHGRERGAALRRLQGFGCNDASKEIRGPCQRGIPSPQELAGLRARSRRPIA